MKLQIFVLAIATALAPMSALAQSPSLTGQALSACLIRSTSAEDRTVLIRWVYIAMSRHPSVSEFATIPDAQRVAANRQIGALFNRLLLESCASETRAAFRADGEKALEVPFGTLGEVAMGGIMEHADVNAGIIEMTAYLDQPRIRALIERNAAQP
jgi:hypothetical protein